jgi:hypothetical protein
MHKLGFQTVRRVRSSCTQTNRLERLAREVAAIQLRREEQACDVLAQPTYVRLRNDSADPGGQGVLRRHAIGMQSE